MMRQVGTHQILLGKLNDDHLRIPEWSSELGQKTSTKNILSRKDSVDYHCFPPQYWPEPFKGQSDRKDQNMFIELIHATQ